MNACVLAVAMLGAPLAASAAGFGKMTVLSNLGQPLNAEIDLVSVQPEEAQSLAVRLATMDVFQERGVEYNSYVRSMRFQLMRRDNGGFYVRVTSSQPINDAYVDFLVELSWAGGRIVRQYTDLLDPPDYKPAAGTRAAVVDVPQTESRPSRKPVATQPLPEEGAGSAIRQKRSPRKAPRRPAAEPSAQTSAPAATQAPAEAAAADSHRVRRGETLGQIAGRYKPSGVSLDQMLYSLYKNNNDAFVNQNINRLKSGAILRIPARDEVAAVSREQAMNEIKAHAVDWNGYKEKVAASVASTPVRTTAPQTSTGKITARTEDKAPSSTGPRDVVKLSKGEAPGAAGNASQQRIRTLEEENAARARALQDANERVALLEKNVRDMQRLLEIKSKAGADLQKKAETQGKTPEAAVKPAATPTPAPTTTATKPVQAPAPAPVASAAPVTAPAASAHAASPAPASAPAVAPVAASQAVASAPVASEPVRKKPKVAPIQPDLPPEPSFMEENGPLLGGSILGLGLLGGALFYFMRKRRARPTFEDSVLTGGDLKSNTVLGSVGASIVDTSNTTDNSFFTDFSREGLGSIDTDEVDPVAEAEVYMAYGRDAQAEEILKDALIKDASRQEVRLKLMEIYAARKNVSNFEMYALELHAATNGAGPLWGKAAAMGRELDPGNALYQDAGVSTPAVTEEPSLASLVVDPDEAAAPPSDMDLDFEIGTVKMEAPSFAEPVETAPEAVGESPVDFDLGAIAEEVAEPAAETSALDFDFSSTASMPAATLDVPAAEPETSEPAKEEAPILDFHFDLGDMGTAPAPQEETMRMMVPPLSDSEPLLDMSPVLDAEPAPASVTEEEATSVAGDMPLNFNFGDLDLDLNKPTTEVEEVAAMPALDAMTDLGADTSALSFNLDDLEVQGATAVEDPIETKLDLAKAYLDMGDSEGAREILNEAASEGSEDQRKRAQGLLASL